MALQAHCYAHICRSERSSWELLRYPARVCKSLHRPFAVSYSASLRWSTALLAFGKAVAPGGRGGYAVVSRRGRDPARLSIRYGGSLVRIVGQAQGFQQHLAVVPVPGPGRHQPAHPVPHGRRDLVG